MTDDDLGPDGGTLMVVDFDPDHGAGGVHAGVRNVLLIAAREYRIATRGRWSIGLAVLFALFSVGIVAFGTSRVGPAQYDAVIASLAELGVYLIPLVALAVGYDTVVGAEESGALDMLFSLPVSPGQVVLGKFLGRAGVLATGMLVGLGVGGVAVVGVIGGVGIAKYAAFVLIATATGSAFLGVGVLVSTVAREKARALALALAAWVWFVLLHDLAAIALIATVDLPDSVLAGMVLTNPADVFRVLVLSQLQTAPGGFAAVLAKAALSMPVLVVALALWIIVPVSIATGTIGRRKV